jgi:hypothetical protein
MKEESMAMVCKDVVIRVSGMMSRILAVRQFGQALDDTPKEEDIAGIKFLVLYPRPINIETFEKLYREEQGCFCLGLATQCPQFRPARKASRFMIRNN